MGRYFLVCIFIFKFYGLQFTNAANTCSKAIKTKHKLSDKEAKEMLLKLGYDEYVASKIITSSPAIRNRIDEVLDIMDVEVRNHKFHLDTLRANKVYRGIYLKLEDYDPKYEVRAWSNYNKGSTKFVSDSKEAAMGYSLGLNRFNYIWETYRDWLKKPKDEQYGILIEFQIPQYLTLTRVFDVETELNPKLIPDDSPFIKRIGLMQPNKEGENRPKIKWVRYPVEN